MKNISKTTKTVLFASLIAVMILPFSSMDYAAAELTEGNKNTKAEAQRQLDEIRQNAGIGIQAEEETYKEKQLELVVQYFDAKEDNDREEMHRIFEKLTPEPKVWHNGTDISQQIAAPKSTMGPIYFTGSTETRPACGSLYPEMSANHDGSATMYGHSAGDYTYFAINMHYPDSVYKQGSVGCNKLNWDHSTANIQSVTTSSVNCSITTFTSAGDAEGKKCDKVPAGHFVAIEGQAFYSSGNGDPFSPFASEDIIFLWA